MNEAHSSASDGTMVRAALLQLTLRTLFVEDSPVRVELATFQAKQARMDRHSQNGHNRHPFEARAERRKT